MTREEWIEMSKHVKRAFSKHQYFLEDSDDVELWYSLMRDLDFNQAKKAFWRYMEDNKFPPAIADIKLIYAEIDAEKDRERQQVREIYKSMENYYPACLRDDDRFAAFTNALKTLDGDNTIDKARIIKKRVIQAVKDVETGDMDNLPKLSECIRKCING